MYLLMMVLDDPGRLADVLRAWEAAGVSGVTILESTGLARALVRRPTREAADVPEDLGHNTLFAVVDDIDVAARVADRVQAILGDLNQPHTGILFLVPVLAAWGLGAVGPAPDA